MNKFIIALFTLAVSLTLVTPDAEAARLGGGRNTGMQRSITPQRSVAPSTPAAPQNASAPAPQAPAGAPAAQPAPKRSWVGPLAGLAAGIGLAALASHFGFGEGLTNVLMIVLLGIAAMMVFRLLFSRRQVPSQEPMQYAGVGGPSMAPVPDARAGTAASPTAGATSAAPVASAPLSVPADFDVEGFLRIAKLNFVRLQAANDQGNLDDMREFLAPEMFAEVQLQLGERGGKAQQTDVVQLNADLLEVVSEGNRHIASVRFHGLLREEKDAAPAAFDEVWNLTKPVDGTRGWMVAGIQQLA